MSATLAEFVGTAILILLGDGVVANVLLGRTKGHGSGLIVIAWGWALAVFLGVVIAGGTSGAHLNPAVTIGLAVAGKFAWTKVPVYCLAQFVGAALGAALVWLHYRDHFAETSDADAKLGVFCTGPALRNPLSNFLSEVIATFVLVFTALHVVSPQGEFVSLNGLPICLVVLGIGISLGGTTGYAINPARDFSPRLMHFLLPIPQKRDSDWSYAWIPVLGPVAGGVLAALVFRAL